MASFLMNWIEIPVEKTFKQHVKSFEEQNVPEIMKDLTTDVVIRHFDLTQNKTYIYSFYIYPKYIKKTTKKKSVNKKHSSDFITFWICIKE